MPDIEPRFIAFNNLTRRARQFKERVKPIGSRSDLAILMNYLYAIGEYHLVLTGIIDRVWLDQLCAAFEDVDAKQRRSSGGKESGTRHPDDLLSRSKAFHGICTQPKVLAAIHHILRRPFRLSQYTSSLFDQPEELPLTVRYILGL